MFVIFWKNYFFTPLFQSNFFQSSTSVTFSEQLFLQSSCSFWGGPFQNSHFFSAFIFQNSYFFRAKLLPSNHILRIGNSLAQLPFGTATYRRYLQKSYFLEADSSAQQQLFQKSEILEKATFSEKQYSVLPTFSGELPSIAATFSEELLFYNIPFQKSYYFTATLFFHSYTSY